MAKKSAPPPPIINPVTDSARSAALDRALGDISKRYGDGSIMRLGEAHQLVIEVIPTGALSLDLALGVGGIPRGRVTEIFGPDEEPAEPDQCAVSRGRGVRGSGDECCRRGDQPGRYAQR